jgi:hypothetical protein
MVHAAASAWLPNAPEKNNGTSLVNALFGFVALGGICVIDACNATRLEILVTFTLMFLGVVYALVGNLILWGPDFIIFNGTDLYGSSMSYQVGSVTRNEARRQVLQSVLMLLASSLLTVMNDCEATCFFRRRKIKNVNLDPLQPAIWQRRSHWAIKGIWATGLVFLGLIFGLPTILTDTTDQACPWLVAMHWCILALVLLLETCYVRAFGDVSLFRVLLGSLLAQQVVLLLLFYFIVSSACPTTSYELQGTPINLITMMALSFTVVIDSCKSTVFEVRMSLGIMAFACVTGITGNLFLFPDKLVFAGVEVGDTGHIIGSWSKNELRRGVLFTILQLLISSFYLAFTDSVIPDDNGNNRGNHISRWMMFVPVAVTQSELVRRAAGPGATKERKASLKVAHGQ